MPLIPITVSIETEEIRSPNMEMILSNETDSAPSGGKLPFGISDALSFLDRLPIWKRVKELPDKVEALERRIAALEQKPKLPICEGCGEGFMRRQKDERLTGVFAEFSDAGGGIAVYKCDKCGLETRKSF